jgi:hypothetical protein
MRRLVPPAPGNPMQMGEPYDMFYRRGRLAPQEQVSPTEWTEPFTFFQRRPALGRLIQRRLAKGKLVGPYVPGWRRTGNFGTVERRGRQSPRPPSKQQIGVIPSSRFQAEYREPYTYHQRVAKHSPQPPVVRRTPQPEIVSPTEHTEPFTYFQRQDLASRAFRGQIGSPRHATKRSSLPASYNEPYNFLYRKGGRISKSWNEPYDFTY